MHFIKVLCRTAWDWMYCLGIHRINPELILALHITILNGPCHPCNVIMIVLIHLLDKMNVIVYALNHRRCEGSLPITLRAGSREFAPYFWFRLAILFVFKWYWMLRCSMNRDTSGCRTSFELHESFKTAFSLTSRFPFVQVVREHSNLDQKPMPAPDNDMVYLIWYLEFSKL